MAQLILFVLFPGAPAKIIRAIVGIIPVQVTHFQALGSRAVKSHGHKSRNLEVPCLTILAQDHRQVAFMIRVWFQYSLLSAAVPYKALYPAQRGCLV